MGIENTKKINQILLIMLIAGLTAYTLIGILNPIFEDLCIKKLDMIATDIMTEEAAKAIKQYDYKNIVSIIKDDKVNVLKTDVSTINSLSTAITNGIIKRFKDLEKETINIPAGAFFGIKYLAGTGPNIKIKVVPVGIVNSEIKTEFKTQGINQTMYRIYLDIISDMKVVMPYKSTTKTVKSQILLVETAIVGDVPATYYNLEGFTTDEMLNLMD